MKTWIVGAITAGFLGTLALAPAQAAETKTDGARTATSQQTQAGWDVSDQRRWRRGGGYGRRFYGGGFYRGGYRPYYGYGYRRPFYGYGYRRPYYGYGYGYRPFYRPYGFYRPAPFFPFF